MAKVFMTVVGMGGYDEATYRIGDNEYTNRSIQKALLTYFKDTGREFDKIVFLLTEKARENNWEKVKYTERKKADDGSELKIPHEEEGLRSFTEKLFPGKAVDKNIADGVNDNDF
ncbi:MAG TPA: TM1812 family CRISPR-associated protein, partial [Ruminococcus sp.]|nr:TM1812 family CRISPR-associated protein [Ruminococcus sp.]